MTGVRFRHHLHPISIQNELRSPKTTSFPKKGAGLDRDLPLTESVQEIWKIFSKGCKGQKCSLRVSPVYTTDFNFLGSFFLNKEVFLLAKPEMEESQTFFRHDGHLLCGHLFSAVHDVLRLVLFCPTTSRRGFWFLQRG